MASAVSQGARGVGKGIGKKVGPLPVWGWLLVAVAGIAVGVIIRKRMSGGQAALVGSPASTSTGSGAPSYGGGYGGGGSSGGGGGSSFTPTGTTGHTGSVTDSQGGTSTDGVAILPPLPVIFTNPDQPLPSQLVPAGTWTAEQAAWQNTGANVNSSAFDSNAAAIWQATGGNPASPAYDANAAFVWQNEQNLLQGLPPIPRPAGPQIDSAVYPQIGSPSGQAGSQGTSSTMTDQGESVAYPGGSRLNSPSGGPWLPVAA